MKTRLKLLALGLTLCLSAPAGAMVVYDEAVNGDLSNIPASPTAVSLSLGSNLILGTTVGPAASIDADIFTFTIGAGLLLDGLVVDSFSSDNNAFIGMQSGDIWTEGTAFDIDQTQLLGWLHFGLSNVGFDILPDIGAKPLAIGFIPPLGAGSYAFLVQETGLIAVDYGLDFQVSAVPVPPAILLFLTGLAGLGLSRFLAGPKARTAD